MDNTFTKKFIGINFIKYGDMNDVIPKLWLIGENKAKWPSKINKIESLARSGAKPKNSWKVYDIKILCHASKYSIAFVF